MIQQRLCEEQVQLVKEMKTYLRYQKRTLSHLKECLNQLDNCTLLPHALTPSGERAQTGAYKLTNSSNGTNRGLKALYSCAVVRVQNRVAYAVEMFKHVLGSDVDCTDFDGLEDNVDDEEEWDDVIESDDEDALLDFEPDN